jgi:hypothetical protein
MIMRNQPSNNLSNNYRNWNHRWFWICVSISQFALAVLLLLFSIRSVWDFVNNFMDDITGLKEKSFPLAFSILIIFFLISTALLAYFRFVTRRRSRKFPVAMIIFFLIQLALNGLIVVQLYPYLESTYLSRLPYWLVEEKAAFIIFGLALVLTAYILLKQKRRKDHILNFLVLLNGIVLMGVLSFAYIALTVRSPQFGKSSLQAAKSATGNSFQIDTKNVKRFPVNSSNSIHPDASLKLDMDKGGNYLVAGDLTGDGIVEIVTLKIWVEPMDICRVKSLVVQSMLLDSLSGTRGKILWSWESDYPSPEIIGGGRGSNAAVVVFDLETGQENNKLLMATDGWLYEFSFEANGMVTEKKVPTGTLQSSDCIVIANLEGKGKHHLLLKDAYHTIWAYDKELNLLWKNKNPGGYLLAHRIGAYDLDNDWKDEILAGATILNGEGEVISTLRTNTVKLWYGGHIDGIVPIQKDDKWYISLTYCDGLGFALFDSDGNLEWELTGEHFEYLVGGYFFNTPELKDQFQLISKVHYNDKDPQVMMNEDGTLLGIFEPASAVFSVDWTGDGFHEMVFASPASVYSGKERMADLYLPEKEDGNAHAVRVADFIGREGLVPDGIPDVSIRVRDESGQDFLYIYANKHGKQPLNYVYPGIGWESSANYFTKYYEYDR